MSDIVEQIRDCARDLGRDDEETKIFFWHCGIMRQSANEIVRLRNALERLASPKAFIVSRSTNEEERARMFFAEAVLQVENEDPTAYAVRRALTGGESNGI